jgi:hypothetical protein
MIVIPENEEELLARVLELLEEQGKRVERRMDFDPQITESDGVVYYSLGRENSIHEVLRNMLEYLATSLLPAGDNRDWEAAAVASRVIEEVTEESGPEVQTDLLFPGMLGESSMRVRATANLILTELV